MWLKRTLPLIIFVLFAGIMAMALLQKQQAPTLKQGPLVSQPLPALTLRELASNKPVPEDFFRGNITVLNLFASWCAPCITELPELEKLAKQGVRVVGIAWHDTPEKIGAWVQAYRPPFTEIWYDPSNQMGVALGVRGIPETLVIDENGTIRAHIQGPIDTHMLDDVLLPLVRGMK